MSCEELDHLIDPYLDRELDPGESLRLEQHLSDCPTCRSFLQECLDFRTFFRSNAPVYAAPPQLRAKVLANIQRERLKRSEEHTSELQSQSNLVCRLLLEKKKKNALQVNAENKKHTLRQF